MQNTAFSTKKTLVVRGDIVNLSVPRVMGILNVTPDSFYRSSQVIEEKDILQRAEDMLSEGATFLDVGGYSSRPGAADVPVEEETARVVTALRSLVKRFPQALISIDTFRSSVARVALEEGAVMVNDISAGMLDPEMFEVVAEAGVPYVMMHMRGTPQTMTQLASYDHVTKEVVDYFHNRIREATSRGIKDVIIDPGFGFAKTREHNFELLHELETLAMLGQPVLVGLSRKSMIWKTLGTDPTAALNGTTALHALAVYKGANILRVHDVKECMEVIKLVSLTGSQLSRSRSL